MLLLDPFSLPLTNVRPILRDSRSFLILINILPHITLSKMGRRFGTSQKMTSKLQSIHFRLESVVNDKISSKTKQFPTNLQPFIKTLKKKQTSSIKTAITIKICIISVTKAVKVNLIWSHSTFTFSLSSVVVSSYVNHIILFNKQSSVWFTVDSVDDWLITVSRRK